MKRTAAIYIRNVLITLGINISKLALSRNGIDVTMAKLDNGILDQRTVLPKATRDTKGIQLEKLIQKESAPKR